MKSKNTIKFKTLLAISKDNKCTYTSIQKHVLISQGKDANKDYKRGYYCTNICDWKFTNLITKKGKFYKLTSLSKLYLKNPQKANDKIKINKLKLKVIRFQDIANHWFVKAKNTANERELKKLKELEDIIYNLMYVYKKSHKIEKDEYILLLESKLVKLFDTIE